MELDQEQSKNTDTETFSKTKPGSLEEFKIMCKRYDEINQRMQILDQEIKTIIKASCQEYPFAKTNEVHIAEKFLKLFESKSYDTLVIDISSKTLESKKREYDTLEIEISYLELTIKSYIERKKRRAMEFDQEQSKNTDTETFPKTKPGSLEEFKIMCKRYNEINQRMQKLDHDNKTIIKTLDHVDLTGEEMDKLSNIYRSNRIKYDELEKEISYLEPKIKPYIERKKRRAEEMAKLTLEALKRVLTIEALAESIKERREYWNERREYYRREYYSRKRKENPQPIGTIYHL